MKYCGRGEYKLLGSVQQEEGEKQNRDWRRLLTTRRRGNGEKELSTSKCVGEETGAD